MGIIELLFVAVGVSMDAFAVAICKGLASEGNHKKTALLCGLWFGIFQMIMPIIGYLLASLFANYIEAFDHWVAFILLVLLGANMIKEAFSKETEKQKNDLSFKKMFALAIATSIDALAIGITFAVLDTNMFLAIPLIGAFTFTLSFTGTIIGKKFGEKYKSKATFIGGLILILMGIKILIEHLFF